MQRVLILGAGGIVGQHMRLQQPDDVDAIYTRRKPDALHIGFEINPDTWDDAYINSTLKHLAPDVIVNLAGENRPDEVESNPAATRVLNTWFPLFLAQWCDHNNVHLIHVSTQGVFNGLHAPYGPVRPTALPYAPVNAYGRQKLEAEQHLERMCTNWTIARLTFVLGVRPLLLGRPNPLESMFDALAKGAPQRQVSDRYFSPLFADDAARALWQLVATCPRGAVRHIGTPTTLSRYALAKLVAEQLGTESEIIQCSHNDFQGIAERPVDTTYTSETMCWTDIPDGLKCSQRQWRARMVYDSFEDRAAELALFFGISRGKAERQLGQGFGILHQDVARSWREFNPTNDDEILTWYKVTPAYCWELTAYHLHEGFNYKGMCHGIVKHCEGQKLRRVLVLGDGIGDLTLTLLEAGLEPIYHDLLESTTAKFAGFRFTRRGVTPMLLLTNDWQPAVPPEPVDAVVALDFFEHLPNVEEWAKGVFHALRPGGWFLAQNAFGIGDDEHEGSIPMHLTVNNKYVSEWPELLRRIGFIEESGSGWWRRPPVS